MEQKIEYKKGEKITTDNKLKYWLIFNLSEVSSWISYEFDMLSDSFTILKDFTITVKITAS